MKVKVKFYVKYLLHFRMDQLVELKSKSGRKTYQYIGPGGEKGRIVSRRQDLVELKLQGKLLNLDVEEISFSCKRKRSVSFNFGITNSSEEDPESLQAAEPCIVGDEGDQVDVIKEAQSVPGRSHSSPSFASTKQLPRKVTNELLKKDDALRCLKSVPEKGGMRDACIVIDEFRTESVRDVQKVDDSLRKKLVEVLTNQEVTDEQLCQLLAESKQVRDFVFEDLIQETLACGSGKNVLKDFSS